MKIRTLFKYECGTVGCGVIVTVQVPGNPDTGPDCVYCPSCQQGKTRRYYMNFISRDYKFTRSKKTDKEAG